MLLVELLEADVAALAGPQLGTLPLAGSAHFDALVAAGLELGGKFADPAAEDSAGGAGVVAGQTEGEALPTAVVGVLHAPAELGSVRPPAQHRLAEALA